MSASEKLRAMGGVWEGLRVGDVPPPTFELRFWPQLVAVVEAAEAMPPMEVGTPYVYARSDECGELHAALAALDEALA